MSHPIDTLLQCSIIQTLPPMRLRVNPTIAFELPSLRTAFQEASHPGFIVQYNY